MYEVNKYYLYYLYCPKCGKQKKRLPEWEARLFVNITKEKEKYNEQIQE